MSEDNKEFTPTKLYIGTCDIKGCNYKAHARSLRSIDEAFIDHNAKVHGLTVYGEPVLKD